MHIFMQENAWIFREMADCLIFSQRGLLKLDIMKPCICYFIEINRRLRLIQMNPSVMQV